MCPPPPSPAAAAAVKKRRRQTFNDDGPLSFSHNGHGPSTGRESPRAPFTDSKLLLLLLRLVSLCDGILCLFVFVFETLLEPTAFKK